MNLLILVFELPVRLLVFGVRRQERDEDSRLLHLPDGRVELTLSSVVLVARVHVLVHLAARSLKAFGIRGDEMFGHADCFGRIRSELFTRRILQQVSVSTAPVLKLDVLVVLFDHLRANGEMVLCCRVCFITFTM